jgi:hypothetical protein
MVANTISISLSAMISGGESTSVSPLPRTGMPSSKQRLAHSAARVPGAPSRGFEVNRRLQTDIADIDDMRRFGEFVRRLCQACGFAKSSPG